MVCCSRFTLIQVASSGNSSSSIYTIHAKLDTCFKWFYKINIVFFSRNHTINRNYWEETKKQPAKQNLEQFTTKIECVYLACKRKITWKALRNILDLAVPLYSVVWTRRIHGWSRNNGMHWMGATLKLFALYFGTVCFPLVFTRVTRTSPAHTQLYIYIYKNQSLYSIHNINGFIYMLRCWTMFSMEFRLVVVLFFLSFLWIYTWRRAVVHKTFNTVCVCVCVYDDGECFPAQLYMRACVFVCQLVVLDTRRTIFHIHTYSFFFISSECLFFLPFRQNNVRCINMHCMKRISSIHIFLENRCHELFAIEHF